MFRIEARRKRVNESLNHTLLAEPFPPTSKLIFPFLCAPSSAERQPIRGVADRQRVLVPGRPARGVRPPDHHPQEADPRPPPARVRPAGVVPQHRGQVRAHAADEDRGRAQSALHDHVQVNRGIVRKRARVEEHLKEHVS